MDANLFSPDHEREFIRLDMSAAVLKFGEGLENELTFADATRYWGIGAPLRGEALDQKLNHVKEFLDEVEHLIGKNMVQLDNGRIVESRDLVVLRAVHQYLIDRFARHLTLLRSREGQS